MALYAALGVIGFLLNGLGAVLGPLQRQLDVDRTAVAYYPSLFAVALFAVGLFGGGPARRFGHRAVLQAAVCVMAAGAVLLGTSVRPLTLLGAITLGIGGALIVQAAPAALTARHAGAAPAAIGEANAVSSFASVLAPWAVALAVALWDDWRIGYVLPILPVAVAVAFLLRSLPTVAASTDPAPVAAPADAAPAVAVPRGLEPGPLFGRWLDVLLAVSVEFCLVFWAADAFREWHHAGSAAAPALAAAFLVGMAVARTAAAPLTRGRHPLVVVLAACGTAAGGFVLFWSVPNLIGATAGLFVAGLGVALMYPVTLARVVAAWPNDRDRASARAAMASGAAIGLAPLLLAGAADLFALRTAYLIVPALLAALAAHAAASLLARRSAG